MCGDGAQIDCGLVTLADDLAAWQAAQQCALDALAIYYDDYGPTASLYGCASIEDENGRQVEVGELCLTCVDATQPTLLCD